MYQYIKTWKDNGDEEKITREEAKAWLSSKYRDADEFLKEAELKAITRVVGQFSILTIEKREFSTGPAADSKFFPKE